MLNEHYDVTTAAYAVGYESLSHFSREYTRMFGESPKRDITELRKSAGKLLINSGPPVPCLVFDIPPARESNTQNFTPP